MSPISRSSSSSSFIVPKAIAETRRNLATVHHESGSWERLVDRYEAIYREVAG
ncbi:MAG TPA: hypothetical protein VF329_08740 [Gammaproteobacteria bacterium]